MVIARQAPQTCPPMIPFCSRFDSVLFTPKMPAISGRFNFSRSNIRFWSGECYLGTFVTWSLSSIRCSL
jgi:hypothetical protein